MKIMKMKYALCAILIVSLLILAGCAGQKTLNTGIKATVFKAQACGCCGIYSQYLEQKGFDVEVVNPPVLSDVKVAAGVPMDLESCHMTKIEDYFIEGHVPVEAINKLLQEKPDIKGIGMVGMPSGSPGMTGKKEGTWTIYGVNRDGSVFDFMKL
ncbi:MAG TPA: DUF411 domain-containing protein [Candidatus Nanoarchaeia archaeon]|nr:DUF411 domain-containing protein [Candidatus Nanoarchaeia archaeon]